MRDSLQSRIRSNASRMSPKGSANYLAFLKTVQNINPDDELVLENQPEDYRQDDHDNVAPMLASDHVAAQQKKLDDLAVESTTWFPDEETPAPHEEPVKALTPLSADINHRGKWGYTKLMTAIVDGEVETVRSLIEQGARTDICDVNGHDAYEKIRRSYDPEGPLFAQLMEALGGR